MTICENHTDCIVLYDGKKCPFCNTTKDLKGFSLDVHSYSYEPSKTAFAPFWLAGNSHTFAEAEWLHKKLGKLIADAKKLIK